jgi:hypothetical protein
MRYLPRRVLTVTFIPNSTLDNGQAIPPMTKNERTGPDPDKFDGR